MRNTSHRGTIHIVVRHRGLGVGTTLGHAARPLAERCAQLALMGAKCYCIDVRGEKDHPKSGGPADVCVELLDWRNSFQEQRESIAVLRDRYPRALIAVFDSTDQTTSPQLELIDAVDLFIKRQVLAEEKDYAKEWRGGNPFTDFLVRELGFDIGDWYFGWRMSEAQASRVRCGWGLGSVLHYQRLARLASCAPPWISRPVKLNARFGGVRTEPPVEWYHQYRKLCHDRLAESAPRGVKVTRGFIPRLRYLGELFFTRVVFSPFGWGEVCFRDYEAVACGCLLLKQDMSHLVTEPDVFRPMETYVPLRWDLADLGERLHWIFDNPNAAADIAANGRRTLLNYFREGGPTRTIASLLLNPSSGSPADTSTASLHAGS